MTGSLSTNVIAERIRRIQQTLPDSVRLIAVTKQVPVEAIRFAYEAGLRDFGESRIQEAAEKQAKLHDLPNITWHLIGHLQSNKVNKALDHFQWIHSLDSLKLAQRIDTLAATLGTKPNVLLQVKVLPDPTKYGWTVDDLLSDLPALDQCCNINIVGLMAIPPYGLSSTETLAVFNRTRELAEKIRQQDWLHITMQHLSMGMSEDYPLAVQAGATMIRPGRILFGERG
ncbi:YggS family pyridoxal phosphate-dependent enzyme [Oculatella sp. LEGE 06141]|uniref:YggS family pyridoxal phosphate-dependent enzyme n=1 Tax=Oculatella sp. LEGE 06141 TaxID=1828648 RepID=UPI00187FDA1E|nr:YggS family pyridoxal phosphate-dependent enzyme [Oculatella sp. LEGE 06141]MBE9181808.1 YggS family pyridoxal phosphate-dependent enzyme [Oculatella sp. LEGE 06141]